MLDLDEIIKKIDPKNPDTLISIITLLGRLWKHNPKKILTNLLIFIKFENKQLRIIISNILIERYNENPDLIIQQLIINITSLMIYLVNADQLLNNNTMIKI